MADECHISSLLVHVRPERADAIAARIAQLAGAELQPCDAPGKLIVTLETASTGEIMDRLDVIHDLSGVISATLIYHHWESASDIEAEAESEADHGSIAPQLSQG
jgi:nitrate reductase NapD